MPDHNISLITSFINIGRTYEAQIQYSNDRKLNE